MIEEKILLNNLKVVETYLRNKNQGSYAYYVRLAIRRLGGEI